jgi:hypothetical protein
MKLQHTLITTALLAMSLSVNAGETTAETPCPPAGPVALSDNPGSACRPIGDGSFAEIVTTMASVLPPEESNALLARYCEPCMKQRLSIVDPR